VTAIKPADDKRLSCSFFLDSQKFSFAGSLAAGVAAMHSASLAGAVLGVVSSIYTHDARHLYAELISTR